MKEKVVAKNAVGSSKCKLGGIGAFAREPDPQVQPRQRRSAGIFSTRVHKGGCGRQLTIRKEDGQEVSVRDEQRGG